MGIFATAVPLQPTSLFAILTDRGSSRAVCDAWTMLMKHC